MQTIKDLESSVAALKLDIQHLSRVSIPKLQKLIEGAALPDMSGIENNITSLKNSLSMLTGKVDDNSKSITNLLGGINAFNEQIAECQIQIAENINDIKENASALSDVNCSLTDLNQKVVGCKNSVSSLSATVSACFTKIQNCESSVSSNAEKITTLQNDLSTIQNSISTAESNVNSLQTKVNEQAESLTTLSSSISALSNWKGEILETINDMSTKINELWNNCGERIVTIYDASSADPNVNWGFTAGMVGGNSLTYDFSPFKRLRIHASVNKYDVTSVVDLQHRKFSEIALHTCSVGVDKQFYLKVNILANKTRLIINQAGAYAINMVTFDMSFERCKGDANYYVYRIEGLL